MHAAVSRWPGRSNSVNNISLFTEKIILKCPEGVGVVSPSWGRIIGVDKRDKGLSQCFDNNAYNCTLSGGVNVLGQTYFGYEDSGLYFCKDDESSKEYYINLTILSKLVHELLMDYNSFSPLSICSIYYSSTTNHRCRSVQLLSSFIPLQSL